MKAISELMKSLDDCMGRINKARRYCLCAVIMALFQVRTVNLQEIATALASTAKISSRTRRLQRLFSLFKFDYSKLAQWSFKLFFAHSDKKLYLTIDRTNWYWGKSKLNIFMLGIAYNGIAIPLFWNMLNKAGNSTGKEQINLLNKFVKTFGKERIAGILGDREFPNKEVIAWLTDQKIPFYYRIKGNSLVRVLRWDKPVHAKRLFNQLNPKRRLAYAYPVQLFGQSLWVSGSRSERGQLMIVVTNQSASNAIAIYLRRWEIETLFHAFKGRGFRFEETHMTQLERIKKLTAVLSIAFCWAHKVGEWRADRRSIRLNKHRNGLRPQNSYFRYGFDCIRDMLFHLTHQFSRFKSLVSHLIPPPDIPSKSSVELAL